MSRESLTLWWLQQMLKATWRTPNWAAHWLVERKEQNRQQTRREWHYVPVK